METTIENLSEIKTPSEVSKEENIEFSIVETDNDRANVFEFMQRVFRQNEPMTKSLKCTEEDTYEFFKNICNNNFKEFYSLMAKNSTTDELIGICLNTIYKDLANYGNNNCLTNKNDDCTTEIDAGPYSSRNANRLCAIVNRAECCVREHLADCPCALKIDILCVDPRYAGLGIGTALVTQALEMAHKAGCEASFACASSRGSQRIFEKLNFKTVKSVKFETFCENAQAVYVNLHDGGIAATLMILRPLSKYIK